MGYPEAILLFLIACGAAYTVIAALVVMIFFRPEEKPDIRPLPPVSVLKPLKGTEPGLRENLASFCTQDYPEYEVLLGFTDPSDDALPVAREVADRSPGRVRVIISAGNPGANRKVANLTGLVRAARYPLIAISDSDMIAGPTYLKLIVNEFGRQPGTGMVTSLYKISRPVSAGAALESLTLALDFTPAVLMARQFEGMTFGLGASMLLTRDVLGEIGGPQSVADHLADDYQLGNRIWKKGHAIILSRSVLEDVAGKMSISAFLAHQLRWNRTYRACRPKGYMGLGITHIFAFTIPFGLIEGPTFLSTLVLFLALILRYGLAIIVYKKVIRDPAWLKWVALIPLKDLASFGIWIWSLFGRKISWRGKRYRIEKNGLISEIR